MSLKTRLDGRSETNKSFDIKDESGGTIATITVLGAASITLDVDTAPDLYIEKPSGWNSLKG